MPEALHVIAGLGRSQGGPSYTVPRLCSALRGAGWQAEILAVEDQTDPPATSQHVLMFRQDLADFPIAGALRLSKDLETNLKAQSADASLFHSHGLWLMPNVYAGRAAKSSAKPLIVSPRGMLSPEALSFSKYKKKFFWALLQRDAYRSAAAWHATSEAEAVDLRAFGIKSPIAIIPNGVDVPPQAAQDDAAERGFRRAAGPRRLLFLSRLHPKKGLEKLLDVWKIASAEYPDWILRIVGPDEDGYELALKAKVGAETIARVEFAGAVYGEAKWNEYQSADVFILPTMNENFGVSVAEALGMGLPAIVTTGAPWSGLHDSQCGWWVENDEAALLSAVRQALALPDAARLEMGARGRRWMLRDFSWASIGENMRCLYEWSIAGGAPPSFVFRD